MVDSRHPIFRLNNRLRRHFPHPVGSRAQSQGRPGAALRVLPSVETLTWLWGKDAEATNSLLSLESAYEGAFTPQINYQLVFVELI